MIFAAVDPNVIGGLLVALLSGTGVAAVAAWRKAGPEAGAIATGSLISVNQELRTEITRLTGIVSEQRVEIDAQRVEVDAQAQQLRSQSRQLEDAEKRLSSMRDELDSLQAHIADLKS